MSASQPDAGRASPQPRLATRNAWAPLGLAVLTALAYANAAPRALVYDDEAVLAQSPNLGGLETIPRLFREPAREVTRLYRPLAMSTLALDRSLHGGDPRGYHVTSIALHVLTTLLVFGLLRALGASALAAFLAGLVFGIHPIHTEAVAVAFNRSEVLATCFVVVALWWLHATLGAERAQSGQVVERRWRAYGGAALFYLAALLCRESAVTLPALAALTLWLMVPRASAQERVRLLAPLLTLAVPFLLYVCLRQGALGGSGGLMAAASDAMGEPEALPRRLVLLAVTARDYLRMLFWPWPLRASCEDYVVRGTAPAVVLHAGLLAAALLLRRRAPALTLGVLFFYVALLPSTKLLAYPAVLAERFVYLPSVGGAIALAFGLGWMSRRFGPRAAIASGVALAVLLVPLTLRRNMEWRSKRALWEAEVRNGPKDWKALLNLSQAYLELRRYEDVVGLCERGIAVAPTKSGFHSNRAIAFASLGRLDEAEASFLRSVELNGRDPVEHANLARLYVLTRRTAAAEDAYARAIELEADPARAHALRGEMLLRCHDDLAGARSAFESALALAPRLRVARDGLRELSAREKSR